MAKNVQQSAGKTFVAAIKSAQAGQTDRVLRGKTFPLQKIFFTFFLIISCFSGFSQPTVYFSFDLFEKNALSEKARSMGSGLTYEDISGSPYASDEFIPGEVILPDSSAYRGVSLRFNIYANQMEFKNKDGQVMEIMEPQRYDRFVIGKKAYRYADYFEGNRTMKGYLQILADGPATLYKKLRINFQEEQKPAAYKDAQPPKFIMMAPEYYLSVKGAPAEKVRSQKQVFELLKDQDPGLAAFVKTEKLNLNKEEELTRAIEHGNRLSK
ncbi:MAG: hypothetical protein PHI28_06125 [Mangrovibacterium sp.]|nr:hypothetical protein [Mangrovibacterium sp.]